MVTPLEQSVHISPLISTDNVGKKFKQMIYFYGESDIFIPLFQVDAEDPGNNVIKIKMYRTANPDEESWVYYNTENKDIVEQNGKLCFSLTAEETQNWQPAVYTLQAWRETDCCVLFLVWNY